ncbi:MAG: hypothetical protein QGI83_17165, partial [Candidatus Latescibacteria bacterium]|nr:hypothetical protein [Candidatus Latescibacterota bacterium]
MKRRLMPLAVSMLAGPALGADTPRISSALTQSYAVPTHIDLIADGRPDALIARPEQDEFAPLADEFADRFVASTGVRLPIVPEGEASSAIDGRSPLIVLGNSASGPLALRLYANKLIGADVRYPGEGGYELRAFPNAMDLRTSVVFLGGSSPQGARAAMDDFFALLGSGSGTSIPFTLRWSCPERRAPSPLSEADIEREVQRAWETLGAFQWQRYRSACGQFCRSAEHYYLSGDDSYGRLCARLLEVLSANWEEEDPEPPTFVMDQVVMALDQVEESAGMSDEDRLRGAELVRKIAETTMEFWEMREPKQRYDEGKLGPIWNHQTYPARSIAHAAQYLKARFDIPAADYWEAVVDHLFRGQITCDQPLEDSANYQWSVAKHTIAYVLATGRLTEYFTNGSLQSALEYAIASHGPAGNEATHGDAWQPFGSIAGALFQQAVTRYRDPRYAYLLSLVGGKARGMWQYPTDIEPREPEDHIGLRTFVVDPARSAAYGIEGIPSDRVLDKVVFRSGWDPEADYMMLDGLNVGNHKHIDANAIIRYSTQGRYWLVDMDYIRAVPKHHNSIVVVRDGEGPDISPTSRRDAQVISEPPLAAELICSSGTECSGLSQSRLYDYGGLDWDRHIFWKAKDFTVVIDRLRAVEPGHYITQAFWRSLGETSLEGSVLRVCQNGEPQQHFCIVNGDGA